MPLILPLQLWGRVQGEEEQRYPTVLPPDHLLSGELINGHPVWLRRWGGSEILRKRFGVEAKRMNKILLLV